MNKFRSILYNNNNNNNNNNNLMRLLTILFNNQDKVKLILDNIQIISKSKVLNIFKWNKKSNFEIKIIILNNGKLKDIYIA